MLIFGVANVMKKRLDDCDILYPEHIQFFFCFSEYNAQSENFTQMEELAVIDNANDAITQFEVVFTKEFAEYGFEWDTYIDVDDLRGEEYYIMMAMPDKLISERKCPVIKQKLFAVKQADYPVFDSVKKTLSYIEHNTDYDVERICKTCCAHYQWTRKNCFISICFRAPRLRRKGKR